MPRTNRSRRPCAHDATELEALQRRVRMVAKSELFRVPIWAGAMRNAGFVELDRKNRYFASANVQRTRDFAARLNELGLLVSKVITIEQQRDGKPERQLLEGLWVVDEEKLRGIDDARIVEIFRNGYMGWVYAHLLSLGNVRRLSARLDKTSRVESESPLETPKKTKGNGAGAGATPRWNGSERRKKPRP